MATATRLRDALIGDGYCHIRGVAPPTLIRQIREFADDAADRLSEEQKQRTPFQGSMISIYDHEELLPILVLPPALEALRAMGFAAPKLSSGFIISKPPEHQPPLFWHQDGILWDDPTSYTDQPVQVFLMYYLVDTSRQNGCLRVIPGSHRHRHRHRLHELPPAHGEEMKQVGEAHPALQPDDDEVDVPVQAGDLVIGDARLLHSAHPNRSTQRRTVITLWFVPQFDELPEHLQAFYGKDADGEPRGRPPGWSDAGWAALRQVLAHYDGPLTRPEEIRTPDARLR